MSHTLVRVTEQPLNLATLLAEAPQSPAHGAQVIFSGVVRDHNHGRKVVGVSYDAFAPLAEKIFATLATEARARWGESLSVAVAHRTGRLAVGDASVVVIVTSPHRREAYEASRFIIDELKLRAPIWKQEHYVDGESEWLAGHALCQHGTTTNPEHEAHL